MTRGYVHLWRKTENSAIFQNEGLFKVAIWCLWRASHKPMTVGIKTGRGISEVSLAPGQFVFGRHSAARALGMSPSTVWKRMLKLKNLGFLNIESDTHYSVITIVNWHTYQAETEKGDSESDRQVTTKEHKQELRELKKKRYVTFFDDFWRAYPIRNGRKVGKAETFKKFCQLKEVDLPLIVQAARNYSISEDVKAGIGIRDPKRFLKDNYWRDWIEPSEGESSSGSYIAAVKQRMGLS